MHSRYKHSAYEHELNYRHLAIIRYQRPVRLRFCESFHDSRLREIALQLHVGVAYRATTASPTTLTITAGALMLVWQKTRNSDNFEIMPLELDP